MTKQWAAATALILAMTAGAATGVITAARTQVLTNETQQNVQLPQKKKAHYLLTGQDGKLAVFIIGKKEPEIIFDIYLNHLPDIDRYELEQGIEIDEYAELLRLIEDYTS